MKDSHDAIHVDKEFEALSLGVGEEEEQLLRESLESEGCRDPIIVLANDGAILDGHRRFRICGELDIPFRTKALRFETTQAAINWIVLEQLAKRSLTAEQRSYLRGKRYLSEVSSAGRPCKNTEKNAENNGETVSPLSGKTDKRLAAEYGVADRTIKSDAAFTRAVDALAEVAPEAKETILSGEAEATRSEIKAVAALPKKQRRKAAKQIAAGEEPTFDTATIDTPDLDALAEPYKSAKRKAQDVARFVKAIFEDEHQAAYAMPSRDRVLGHVKDVEGLVAFLSQLTPHELCRKCKGKKCNQCNKLGWIPKGVAQSLGERGK